MPYIAYSSSYLSGSGMRCIVKSGSKLKPFNKALIRPMAYSVSDVEVFDTNLTGAVANTSYWQEAYLPSNYSHGAYNRAYGRFKAKVYDRASVLTAVAERAQTIEMMTERLSQLVKGASQLKKGNLKGFLQTFGVSPHPRHAKTKWSRPRDFSSIWLEYWMGWAPTVGDVYTAVKALGQDVPHTVVRAGSTENLHLFKVFSDGGNKATTTITGKVSVHIQGRVTITNPTLFQMESLGIANPALTAWEVIPFSWFVGWFVNIEQCIARLTDFLGLKLDNLIVSTKKETTESWIGPSFRYKTGGQPAVVRKKRIVFARTLPRNLPPVRPVVRLPNGLSLSRGATAISLLVTLFSPSGKH